MKRIPLAVLIINTEYNSNISEILSYLDSDSNFDFKTIIITPFDLSKKDININENLKICRYEYQGEIDAYNYGIKKIKETYKKLLHVLVIDDKARFNQNPFTELYHYLSKYHSDNPLKDLVKKYVYKDELISCYSKANDDELYYYKNRDNIFEYRYNNLEYNNYFSFNPSFFVLPLKKAKSLPAYLLSFKGINDSKVFSVSKTQFLNDIYIDDFAYEVRMNPSDLYYHFRNKLILNKNLSKEEIANYLKNEIDINLSYYRYNDVYAVLYALNDYLKGENYLSSLDLNYYNSFINTLNPILLSDNELDTFFTWKEWEKTRETLPIDKVESNKKEYGYQDENALEYAVIDLYNQVPYATYNVKKILNWDIDTSRGYISRKNLKILKICLEKQQNLFKKLDSKSSYSLSVSTQGNKKEFELFDDNKEEYESLLKIKTEVDENHKNTKINDKQILFYVGTRLGFCCNPKYLLLELLNRKRDHQIIWVAHKPELCDEIRELGVEVISLHDHDLFIKNLYQSKVIIYNDSLPFDFTPRKEQTLINTWHGAINYKHIGLSGEPFMSEYDKKAFMLTNPTPTYFVAGSNSFLEDTSKSFNYPEEIFLKTGLPRNDILLNSKVDKNKLKEKFNIQKDKKVCLYCPTFRKDNVASVHDLDFDALKIALNRRFGGEWEILYRGHVFTVNFWKKQDFIDVTNYPDQQDILLFTDVLVSDYSSIMWDASLINIPVFVYSPDYYSYLNNERGFTDSFKNIPYPISLNNEELVSNIINFDLDRYLLDIKKHHQEEGCFDKGDACKSIIDLIKD